MSDVTVAGYAGDVSPTETYERLKADSKAVLVDVRRPAEWTYVGLPVLSAIGKEVILAEWNPGAPGGVDGFARRLAGELEARGIGRDAAVYFICRSGSRSRHAAIALTAAGYGSCFNVSTGFEGPLDKNGHRGVTGGWKAEGLPWQQT